MTEKFHAPETGALAWFMKERVAPLNATILLSTTVSGVVDFAVGHASLWLELCALACVLLLLFVLSVSLLPAGAGKPVTRRLWATVCGAARGLRRGGMLLYLLAAALVFGGAAYASEQHRAQGGVLAATFPDLALLQQKLDLLHSDNQQLMRKLDGLKQETSANPRKELANQGISWEQGHFHEAVHHQDVQTAALFLQGGMPPNADIVQSAFEGSEAMQKLLAGAQRALSGKDCRDLVLRLRREQLAGASAAQRALVAGACGNAAGLAEIAALARDERERAAATTAEAERLRGWLGRPEHCIAAMLAGHGPELRFVGEFGTALRSGNDGRAQDRAAAQERCEQVRKTITEYESLRGSSDNALMVQQWMK